MSTVLAIFLLGTDHLGLLGIPGAAAGLLMFYRACRDSRRTRLVLNSSDLKITASNPSSTNRPEPPPEIIHLSPRTEPLSSAEMTQQGKIAAALLKAGVRHSGAWPGPKIETPPTAIAVNDAVGMSASAAAASPATAIERDSAPSFPSGHSASSPTRPTTVWLWGGPALTLVSLYVVLAHFGWL
jgi:hypothetical protein